MPFFYTSQLAVKNERVCSFCGRASYLWGGNSCDACDKDSNGLPDKNEPTGITTSINTPSLFKPEEKGWAIVAGATLERIPKVWGKGFIILPTITQQKGLPSWAASSEQSHSRTKLTVLKAFQRRIRQMESLASRFNAVIVS